MSKSSKIQFDDDIENLGIPNERVIKIRSLSEINYKPDPIKRYIGIWTSICLIIIILSSILVCFLRGENYQILSFELKNYNSPFVTNIVSVLICITLIIGGISVNIYVLTFNMDSYYLQIYYEEMANLFNILNFTFIFTFLMGMIFEKKEILSIILSIIFTFFSDICCVLMYRKIRKKINPTIITLIAFHIYISILLSFLNYVLIYNLTDIFAFGDGTYSDIELRVKLAIVSNSIYAITAIVCISTLKDVVYPMILIIIEIGYMATNNQEYKLDYREWITCFSILAFILISVMITIMKYKKLAFSLDENLVENLKNSGEDEDN